MFFRYLFKGYVPDMGADFQVGARTVSHPVAIDRKAGNCHPVDDLCIAATPDPASRGLRSGTGNVPQGNIPCPLSVESVKSPGICKLDAQRFPAPDILDPDIFESNLFESAVIGNHHGHGPRIDLIVLSVFQHNVVMETDIPERYQK